MCNRYDMKMHYDECYCHEYCFLLNSIPVNAEPHASCKQAARRRDKKKRPWREKSLGFVTSSGLFVVACVRLCLPQGPLIFLATEMAAAEAADAATDPMRPLVLRTPPSRTVVAARLPPEDEDPAPVRTLANTPEAELHR